MAYDFQIVVDAGEPHVMADWWAETLGWQREPSDEDFIRKMVAEGHASESDTMTHNGVLVWREGAAILPPEVPGAPYRRILFQLVPEAKSVKNRVHLDLRVGPGNAETVRDQLIERGATFLHQGHQGPHTWFTLHDPELNEFCVS